VGGARSMNGEEDGHIWVIGTKARGKETTRKSKILVDT
jgi:hypothetical protein